MNNGEIKFIFCTECGTKNDIDANFCTSCGTKLVKPTAPVVIPEPEAPVTEEPKEEVIPTAAPIIEESAIEELAVEDSEVEDPEVEEPAVEEAAEEESAPEAIPVVIPVEETPAAEEAEPEEAKEEEHAHVIIPEAEDSNEEPAPEEPAVEESVAEETKEEEPALVVVPVIIPKAEEPAPVAEEPVKEEPKEEQQEETVPPVVVAPVAAKISKKEEKLAKKLEEAKKQAQEQALKDAQKAEAKAQKAEAKAQKAEAKAEKAENKARKAEEKAKKSEKSNSSDSVQNNSYYYYNPDSSSNEAQAAPKSAKKKRKQNFFLKILSFLLAIILMASLIIAVPITLLNLFLTDHNIDVIVDRAISSIELDKIEFSTADGTKTLSEAIHDVTNEFEGWDHITEEQINDALLEDFVKQFVTDALDKLGMSLKEGEAMLGWTPEEIYGFIEANKETIEQLARDAGYEGKLPIEEKKDMMIANIEQRIGKDGISAAALFGNSGETEKLARYLEAAQALFSINILYLAWGLVAFIIMLIIFTNIGYFGAFCRTCGFPAFIVGALYFLVGLGVSPLLSIVTIPIPIVASAIEFTAGFLGAMLMDISIIVLGVGLVLVVISFISDAIRRKIDSKKNA
jgi:hypothetical protein